MREVFFDVLALSAAGSLAYGLFELLSLIGGVRLSQSWRCRGLLLVGAIFALPVDRVWRFLPCRGTIAHAVMAVKGGAGAITGHSAGAAFWRGGVPAAVWLIIASGLIVWELTRFARCKAALKKSAVPADRRLCAVASEEAARAGIRGKAVLYVSPMAQSPMLTGFIRPVVMLPEGEWSEEGLRLILAHEYHHFRRGDLWKKMFFTLLWCVHWFNPLAYLLGRDFGYRMETACDERVVRALDRDGRLSYGRLLIDCAPNLRQEAAVSFVAFASGRKKLERRLRLMMRSNKKTRTILGVVLALTLLAGCLAVTALASDTVTVKDMLGSGESFTIDLGNARVIEDYDQGDSPVSVKAYDPETGEEIELNPVYVDIGDCQVLDTAPAITYIETPQDGTLDAGDFVVRYSNGECDLIPATGGTLTEGGLYVGFDYKPVE